MAVGDGEARAPAETATLQLLLGPSPFDDSFMPSGGPEAGADPGASERDAAQPLVRAIQGAGVPPGDIRVLVSPALQSGYYGPGGGLYGIRIDVTVRGPNLDTVNALVNATAAAALENDRGLVAVGVAYAAADCAALQRHARERANDDARANAAAQAQVLGAPLGDLFLASDVAPTNPDGGATPPNECSPPPAVGQSPFVEYQSLSVPRFDPAAPTEAVARGRVSLSFSIADG